MRSSLFDLTKLVSRNQAFAPAASRLGFASIGEIDRFLFQSYGKAIKDIPMADRPKGSFFFLAAPAVPGAIARPSDLKPILNTIQSDIRQRLYEIPANFSGQVLRSQDVTSSHQREMASGSWPVGHAQYMSKISECCVVWGNGVSATVFLDGNIYIESPDVIAAIPTGMPTTFQHLSWADGEIIFEFASRELNDTTETGIWCSPDEYILRPKPEKLMSVGLGKFLKHRLAGYRHHEDEPYVDNEGRADISLTLYDGVVYIVEIKWVGRSLIAAKLSQDSKALEQAAKKNEKGWFTEFRGGDTFTAGAKQLAQYYQTGKYEHGFLAVFDCGPARIGRKHECLSVDPTHVLPCDSRRFTAYRACVDPRKASKRSKTGST